MVKKLFFRFKILLPITLLVFFSLGQFSNYRTIFASTHKSGSFTPSTQVESLLNQLTPEEKIGQLFLISFNGNTALTGSAIEQLISQYHIGGVILKAQNDNFDDNGDILENTQSLISQLQQIEWDSSRVEQVDTLSGESFRPSFIPLMVGISQEGDGSPYDQIFSELTRLPTPLTIGATWQPDNARKAGSVLGRELSSLGFNLLIGPSLDILETPHPEVAIDMGTRTFGGTLFGYPKWDRLL